jgi:predicted kinase
LPLHRGLCYTSIMRKWMQDRLLRRKKKADPDSSAPQGNQSAPLQPAYYEADPTSKVRDEAPDEVPPPAAQWDATGPEEPAQGAPASETPEPSTGRAKPPAASRGDRDRSRRRRRGRRGRGGTGPKPDAPARTTPRLEPLRPTLLRPADDQPAPPDQAPTATAAQPRGVVVLAIGLPGSGKSSWFKRQNIQPLSTDLLRGLLFDDPNEQRFQDLVFSNLRSLLRARLVAKRPMNYVDATNLTPHERQSWIKLANDYQYEVHALYFDVPLEVCLERNHKRERQVTDDVMQRMASKLRPPAFEEGFTKIKVVRVKKKEEAV